MKKRSFLVGLVILVCSFCVDLIILKDNVGATSVYSSLSTVLQRKWRATQAMGCLRSIVTTVKAPEGRPSIKVLTTVFDVKNYSPFISKIPGVETQQCTNIINDLLKDYDGGSLYDVKWGEPERADKLLTALGYVKRSDVSSGGEYTIQIDVKYKHLWQQLKCHKKGSIGSKVAGLFYQDISELFPNSDCRATSEIKDPENFNNYAEKTLATLKVTPNNNGSMTYKLVETDRPNSEAKDSLSGLGIDLEDHNLVLRTKHTVSLIAGLETVEKECWKLYKDMDKYNIEVVTPLLNDVEEFSQNLRKNLLGKTFARICVWQGLTGADQKVIQQEYVFNSEDQIKIVGGDSKYVYTGDPALRADRMAKFANFNNLADVKFSDADRYTLYYNYLQEFVPKGVQNRLICNKSLDNTDGLEEIVLKASDGKFKTCHINLNGQDPKDYQVSDQITYHPLEEDSSFTIRLITMRDVIDWFNDLSDARRQAIINDIPAATDDDGGGGIMSPEGNEEECYEGSGPLGWILCPVIKGLTTVGSWMWNYVEKNLMQLPVSEIFKTEGGVREAWSMILNIANVAFVILFMLVIFSQLTGVGIDNYGIKKILPRLIMVAVLVNLSWIICQLALDLSNISGWGLNSMLSDIAKTIASNSDAEFTNGVLAGVTEVLLVVGGSVLFAWLNPIGAIGAAFAVLGFIITTVLSILVLYLVLLIREAGIIMLVVLAPVAIVGYALPNTEKLSKKWFELFKALLVVYPLCGLVMGGGRLASVVLASIGGENTGMKLAALIVQVLPFFLIPTLLKNSLSLMGNIGNKLSAAGKNFGRRTSGAIQRGVQNSERFKQWSGLKQEKAELRKANMRRGLNDWQTRRGLDNDAERKEYKDLAAKVRSNTATEAEKKRFTELRNKSRYQPSELRQRRLSADNAKRREYESNRDKAMYGADDIVATGRIQSDKYANRKEAEDTSEWTDHFYRDSKGNTWLSDGKGGYSTVDKDGITHTRTAKQMDAMRKNGDVKMVSRSEAMANQDMVSRMKQTGRLAGYANTSKAQAAGRGAILSSAESSQAELIQDAQSGQADVIRAQHDDNVTRRREVAGKAEASAAFRAQGLDTVTSVKAAQQAAEARLTGVASQNLAADDYANKVRTGVYNEVDVRDNAVLTGAIRNINQKTDQIASDRVGEVLTNIDAATKRSQDKYNIAEANNDPSLISVTRTDVARKRAEDAYNKAEAINDPNLVSVTKMEVARQNAENAYNLAEAKNKEELVSKITPEYAQTLEQKRFDTAQEKMYGEQMTGNTRSQSLSDLAGALGIADGSPEGLAHPNDVNYVMAAIKDIADKGGYEDLNTFIANNGRAIRQNPNINKAVSEYMATMSAEPAAKAYGKYTAKMRDMGYSESEISSYDMWLNAPDFGADADPNGAFSFQGFLRAGGDTALVNASKDTAKFYASKPEIVEHITPQMSINGALHAKDNETLLAHNDLIKKVLNKRPNREEAVKEVVSSTSSSQWSHMEDSTFGAIMDPYKDTSGHVDMSKVPADVLKAFGQAKKDLIRAGGTVGANMRPEVKRFFDSIPDSYVK